MECLFVLSQVVDMIWIGRLGATSVAGVGIAQIIVMLVASADLGLIAGIKALIARNIGAGDRNAAEKVAGQAYLIGFIWGLLVTLIGFFFAPNLMSLFAVSDAVIAEGTAFMRVMFGGWVGMELFLFGLYSMQSSGDTLNPMKIELLIRVIHITLCPFLVLGLWFFPKLGVSGAAFSNVISQTTGTLIVLVLLLSGRTRIRLRPSYLRVDFALIGRILKIGIPALVMNLQRAIGNFILTWFIAPFGTAAVAAHSIAARIEMFIFLPSMALGSGAGVLVGQNLGAHQPERASRSAWMALGIVQIFMMLSAAVFLIFARQIISAFTSDADTLLVGTTFLRIATVAYMVLALTFVLQNCIAGAGDTVPNMIISVVSIWAVQLPLAWLLPNVTDLGVYGIRWAIVINAITAAIATFIYFRLGRWKNKRV
jgi:putative MATE family efflux protein